MATSTRTRKASTTTTTTTPAAPYTPTTAAPATTPVSLAKRPVAVAAPQGSTATVVAGTPQAQVPHLATLATLPVPVALAAPTAPWPGWGRAVRVQGAGWVGTAYANRGNVCLRATHAVAAAIAAGHPGAVVRGNGTYVQWPVTATGTPQA